MLKTHIHGKKEVGGEGERERERVCNLVRGKIRECDIERKNNSRWT
jgi:hypothetical protein